MLINNIKPQNIINPKLLPSFKGNGSSADIFGESLTKTFVSTGFLQGYSEVKGKAGKSDVELKETEILQDGKRCLKYKGKIGSNPAEIIISGKEITGTVGTKGLELTFNKKQLNDFCMQGLVGGECINFINGSKTNEMGEDKDTVITVLSLLGCKLNIKDDRIASLGFSKQAKEDKTRQAFSDWQMVQQNQIMAQDALTRDIFLETSSLFKEDLPDGDLVQDDELKKHIEDFDEEV